MSLSDKERAILLGEFMSHGFGRNDPVQGMIDKNKIKYVTLPLPHVGLEATVENIYNGKWTSSLRDVIPCTLESYMHGMVAAGLAKSGFTIETSQTESVIEYVDCTDRRTHQIRIKYNGSDKPDYHHSFIRSSSSLRKSTNNVT